MYLNSFCLGSLTLHHWQQLAKPHLATILDPHPGIVTKGFRPLAQDALYRLSDMEEDEESDEDGRISVLEKGAAEQRNEHDDEEEEEGGITFKVHCSSTPEERKERKHPVALLPTPPLSPAMLKSTGTPSTSVQSDLRPTPSLSPLPASGATTSSVQTPSQISTSTTSSCVTELLSVQNPGKCQSSTFSTYTFTTCRILHPCDVTQVTLRWASTGGKMVL